MSTRALIILIPFLLLLSLLFVFEVEQSVEKQEQQTITAVTEQERLPFLEALPSKSVEFEVTQYLGWLGDVIVVVWDYTPWWVLILAVLLFGYRVTGWLWRILVGITGWGATRFTDKKGTPTSTQDDGGVKEKLLSGRQTIQSILTAIAIPLLIVGSVWVYEPDDAWKFVYTFWQPIALYSVSIFGFVRTKRLVEEYNSWDVNYTLALMLAIGGLILGTLRLVAIL